MGRLSNYSSKQPSSQLLKEGEHDVRLISVIECTSFNQLKAMNIAGDKEKLPEWKNPTDQVAIMVGNSEGAITHRINLQGWKRYAELTDKELASGKFEDIKGFACEKTKKGLMRIEDADRTATCERILDHFIWALGYPEGTNAQDCVDNAIAEKKIFGVVIVAETWEESDAEQLRITKFVKKESEVKEKKTIDLES
jgi:hypothetical protein